jgi:hypothetical protein
MPPFTFMAYTMTIQNDGNRFPDRVVSDTSQGHLRPVLTKASLIKQRCVAGHSIDHALLRQYFYQ